MLGARQPLGRSGRDKKTMGGLDKQSHKGGGEVKSRSMTMEAAIHLTNRSLPLRRRPWPGSIADHHHRRRLCRITASKSI